MAMLAEPRRKQRIGPNPRGKFFTEDEDNRGRQMLMKMGWKTGEGLGMNGLGDNEPIKPKFHTDARGLGYDRKTDPWVAHNEEFEQLLKNLHTSNDESLTKPTPAAEEGLEKKSKGSRSRIHYHKFVRNKDLSRASAKDISCIFGNNNILNGDIPNSIESSIGEDANPKKKKSKKRKHCNSDNEDETIVPNACSQNQVDLCQPAEECTTEVAVKKKKSKKHSKNRELDETCTEELSAHEMTQSDELVTKKNKKKNKAENITEEEPNIIVPSSDQCEEVTTKKKKKKSKNENINETCDTVEQKEMTASEESVTKKKKKKKKRDNVEGETENIPDVQQEEEFNPNLNVKKKKPKKRNNEDEDEPIIASDEFIPQHPDLCVEPAEEEPEEATSVKKKKNKKRKHETDEEQTQRPENVSNTNDSSKTSETDKVESFGSLQFINRGSIVDYFKSKMQSKLLSSRIKI